MAESLSIQRSAIKSNRRMLRRPSLPQNRIFMALLSVVPLTLAFTSKTSPRIMTNNHAFHTFRYPSSTTIVMSHSYPSDLDTAYEWIANEKYSDCSLQWFHPTELAHPSSNRFHLENVEQNYVEGLSTMPLYPLGAVHIPYSGVNYTLNNIEDRNVNMARDLANNQWPSSLFCTTLRARDTNRIASVGTIMQVREIEDRSVHHHNKVVVTCQAVGIADIISIENPLAWEEGHRSGEYLIANVKIRPYPNSNETILPIQHKELPNKLLSNYQKVKDIYSNSQSIASNELPPYAKEAIQTLCNFTLSDITSEYQFWTFIETWQMLCNTLRQAKRNQLSSIINEISLDAAMELDGPLELPIKRHRLPTFIQIKLDMMEQHASRDYLRMGMDPTLDFQVLMGMREHWDRVEMMAGMVEKELERLKAKESLRKVFLERDSVDVRGGENDFR